MLRTILNTKRRGETLIEILVALFSLTLGMGAAVTLILIAMKTNVGIKDQLVATNLAREGLEAVRNIRDTNWLRWSSDIDFCWDIRDNVRCCNPATAGASCPTAPDKMVNGSYRVGVDQGIPAPKGSFLWTLVPHPTAKQLDLVNGAAADNQFYNLAIIDRFPTFDSDNDGSIPAVAQQNDLDLYAHMSTTGGAKATAGLPIKESMYYRMIYLDRPSPTSNEIQVHSVVQWLRGGDLKEVRLSTTITNYLDN